jgi:hypothetical protein
MDGQQRVMDELIELEKQGWEALSTGRSAARAFYETVLDDSAVMVFPGDLVLAGVEEILASLDAQPWSSFELGDPRVVSLAGGAVSLVYRATAHRGDGAAPYGARVSSTYVRRDGGWRLALHQQTPV